MITIEIPLKTVSEGNSRDHWRVSAKRHAQQKASVRIFCGNKIDGSLLPCTVKLIRIGRKLDDDNLQGALKYVRDAVAELLIPGLAIGRADDDSRITWQYQQEKGKNGIILEIQSNIQTT